MGGEDLPIVTPEWKNKVEYWERVLETLYEDYNDHTIVDASDSSFEDFWPKTRQTPDVGRNALHAISNIMDGDFDTMTVNPCMLDPSAISQRQHSTLLMMLRRKDVAS